MSSLPLKHRRKSLSSSPPPSPPSPDISPLRPSTSSSVYRYTTSAYTRSHKWTGSDYDDVPDFEPALISDDALTALSSSSRAPSLAPSDADVQDAYVDIVSSSPIHDIPFLRPSTPPRSSRSKFVTETDDKASMAREDVAAALLALHAYPRLGSSPLTATFPTFPALLGNSSTRVRDFPIPRTPSPTLHLPIRLAPITRLPSPGTEDRTSRASIDRIQKDAGSSEGRVHGCDVSADNFSQHQGRSKTSTPERQGALYSPLPPSSPFSEDEREDVHEDIADSPIAKALSKSQSLTQVSLAPLPGALLACVISAIRAVLHVLESRIANCLPLHSRHRYVVLH
ncbi:hypothetical protein BV25DRAFT_1317428 [Artomyces pyxidatus]|uniref:Uncharacterized protein n=1 Tax=Artomyces pyxidatus TaxID=48021 RepID=A0ACB8SP38_9AGAM|nr:hypothetical protein BV25DRAFT_1317428 [Artomyces pyxidatus]